MPTELEKKFPNITKWIKGDGWIEVGSSSYEGGMAKAFDEGGCELGAFGHDADFCAGEAGGKLAQIGAALAASRRKIGGRDGEREPR